MQRHLGELFGVPIPAYVSLLIAAFVLTICLARRQAVREGLDTGLVVDVGLLACVAGVMGARLGHVLLDGHFWDYVHLCSEPSRVVWPAADRARCLALDGVWHAETGTCRATRSCFAWANVWSGGRTYYGGLMAALVACALFVRRHGGPVRRVADIAGVVAPLGLCLGRVGCFLEGCCFGTPTGMPWGVRYPGGSAASRLQSQSGHMASAGLPSWPVHPTPLYEAAGSLAIGAFLLLWLDPRKRFDGQIFLVFLAAYAVLRFGLEAL